MFKRGPKSAAFDAGGVNRGIKPFALSPAPKELDFMDVQLEETDSDAEVLVHKTCIHSQQ